MTTPTDDPIYLDYNATTPLLPAVLDAMLPYLRAHFGNPSSDHVYGRRAHDAVERARAQVASLLRCDPDEVVFTSGGTEANNLALRGALDALPLPHHVVTSSVEHPATAAPLAWLESRGARVTRIGLDPEGRLRLDEARAAVAGGASLVTVIHAHNETGVLQPLAELVRAARGVGALVHTDAAQSVGKVGLDVRALGVDLLSFAGHKLYAPKGVGALYVRRGTAFAPFARGAGHERGLRPGTENVASLVGLGVACDLAARDLDASAARITALRDRLWTALAAGVSGLACNGGGAARLPNTLSVRFPGVTGAAVLAGAPEVAASTASACHAGSAQAPAVVLAMSVAPEEAVGTVRLSLGRGTTDDDVARAAEALVRAWRGARSSG